MQEAASLRSAAGEVASLWATALADGFPGEGFPLPLSSLSGLLHRQRLLASEAAAEPHWLLGGAFPATPHAALAQVLARTLLRRAAVLTSVVC